MIASMEARVLHVSEADAERELAAILQHVRAGAEVVIERDAQAVAVIRPAGPPYHEKLAGAKRRQFTALGKQERIAKSLAALSEPPYIRLTANEWREIVQDPDLED
jgi:antitoxin (DNA-binding transcriptional repressor) of toxin-antitoxin stability system